jgi:hypothetical protein
MSELGNIVGGTSGAAVSAEAMTSIQAGGPKEFDYFDVEGYCFNFPAHSFLLLLSLLLTLL